jgi:hypothetical protein
MGRLWWATVVGGCGGLLWWAAVVRGGCGGAAVVGCCGVLLWWVAVVCCCGVSIFKAAVVGRLWWADVVCGGLTWPRAGSRPGYMLPPQFGHGALQPGFLVVRRSNVSVRLLGAHSARMWWRFANGSCPAHGISANRTRDPARGPNGKFAIPREAGRGAWGVGG